MLGLLLWILQWDIFPPSQGLVSSHKGRGFFVSHDFIESTTVRVSGIHPGLTPLSCILRIQTLTLCLHHKQPLKQASKSRKHPKMALVYCHLSSFLLPFHVCHVRNILEKSTLYLNWFIEHAEMFIAGAFIIVSATILHISWSSYHFRY